MFPTICGFFKTEVIPTTKPVKANHRTGVIIAPPKR